jgi:hypothetical protein
LLPRRIITGACNELKLPTARIWKNKLLNSSKVEINKHARAHTHTHTHTKETGRLIDNIASFFFAGGQ